MSTELNLLVLEDEPNDAELAIAELEHNGFQCTWDRVETKEDFLTRLEENTYELILSDYSMPAFDGMTALKLLQERNIDLPFILISGTVGEEVAIDSLKAGATDYVMKGRISRLGPVTKRALQEHQEHRQRQRVTMELKKSQKLLSEMIEAIPDVIFMKDAEGTYLMCNREFAKLIGLTANKIPGKTDYDLFPKDKADFFREQDREAIAHKAPRMNQESNVYPDGRIVWLEATKTPVYGTEGELAGILGIAHDITVRKNNEQALKKHNQELEQFNRLATGRELRMIELKKEINALCRELGRETPYA
jgi:PAS domain S-box-containing protein